MMALLLNFPSLISPNTIFCWNRPTGRKAPRTRIVGRRLNECLIAEECVWGERRIAHEGSPVKGGCGGGGGLLAN